MKLLLALAVCVLEANAAYAIDCSVNELVKTPMRIQLPGEFELCMMNSQNKRLPKCISQTELNYTKEDIQSQAKLSCGLKGSEVQAEADGLTATLISCENDEGTTARKYSGLCVNSLSKDEKYLLKICTDLQTVVTLAIPVKSKDQSRGLFMLSKIGSNHVSHVNEVSCGKGRLPSRLNKTPIPRDPRSEREL